MAGRTRDEAIAAAALSEARADVAIAALTPREQAEAAWHADSGVVTEGRRLSVEEIEDRIRADRGLPALDRRRRSA